VGGCHEHSPRFGGRSYAGADIEPLSIDRNRTSLYAGGNQGLLCQGITGVFDPRLHIGLEQHPDHEINRVLGAGGNDDLPGIALHGARRTQLVANGRAKFGQAARIGITEVIVS
jgi:hypothetical protein